jgi:hypothetical protein
MLGRNIAYKRGVRQGYHVSPVLYALGWDLLQSYINRAFREGRLKKPISNRGTRDFPIIQYADDNIIVMQAEAGQLGILKEILEQYTAITGLKVNYHNFFSSYQFK